MGDELVSKILCAAPKGPDFQVLFTCGCAVVFRGDYGQRVQARTKCNSHAALPPDSDVLVRMYDAATSRRDEAEVAVADGSKMLH